ncbi:hypothetical protein [Dysgonomonas sp. BGC7]|uniref:hypothetical protein n=1 Tax=Dysgonomonas sp. BGC7 TaxID=1658008 RepID=UPI0006812D92|nr:hypothetical protein [Dysgonomonas sp. BGC7]MBD8388060.1 hypothetical protein [Dysgonomonas sp. BGC7]
MENETPKIRMNGEIVLEFISPKELNNLASSVEKKGRSWRYVGEEDSILTLDTNDWTIECEKKAIKALITDWIVDESQYVMKVKSDPVEDNFEDLSYSFAVSMIGQLVDKKELINYLSSLQTVYLNASPRSSDENELHAEKK